MGNTDSNPNSPAHSRSTSRVISRSSSRAVSRSASRAASPRGSSVTFPDPNSLLPLEAVFLASVCSYLGLPDQRAFSGVSRLFRQASRLSEASPLELNLSPQLGEYAVDAITDDVLLRFAHYRPRRVNLAGCTQLTERGLSALFEWSSLESFSAWLPPAFVPHPALLRGKPLRELDLDGSISDAFLRALAPDPAPDADAADSDPEPALPVAVLTLRGRPQSSAGLACISRLTRLESLSIARPERLPSMFVRSLSALPRLRSLSLGVFACDEVAELKQLRHFRTLALEDEGLRRLAGLGLETLACETGADGAITAAGLACLPRSLTRLSLPVKIGGRVSEAVRAVLRLGALRALTIVIDTEPHLKLLCDGLAKITAQATGEAKADDSVEGKSPSPASVAAAAAAAAHTHVLTSLCVISDKLRSLQPLLALPGLTSLDLRCCALTDADLAPLQGLASLTELRLRSNDLTGSGLSHIGALPLRTLDLTVHNMRFKGEALQLLTTLAQLRFLALRRCKGVEDSSLGYLSKLPSLQELHLSGAKVTDEGLRILRDLPSLQLLAVDRRWPPGPEWFRYWRMRGVRVLAGCV